MTLRRIELPSLADDLEEVLIPRDVDGYLRPMPWGASPVFVPPAPPEPVHVSVLDRRGRRCRCGAPKWAGAEICSSCRKGR